MANTVSDTIPDDWLNRCIQQESAGNPNAKARTSTATGLGQFLNKTWVGVVHQHEPEWAEGLDEADLLPLRKDGHKSIEMLARHWEDNYRTLGGKPTLGDLYLAHFAGAGTAKKIRKADADKPVVDIVGPRVIKANPYWDGLTCAQARQWAADKMRRAKPRKDWVSEFYEPPEVDEPEYEQDEDADITPHGQSSERIEMLQRDLDGMGYHEVGRVDGDWGGGTKAALAAFLNDRGIDGPVDMRKSNMDEVAKAVTEGFMRPRSEARANATPKELAPHNETVKQGLRAKLTALWGMIVSAIVGVFTTVMDKFSDYWHALAVPRKLLGDVPIAFWFLLVIGGCAAIWYFNNRTVEDTTQKFRDRKLLQ